MHVAKPSAACLTIPQVPGHALSWTLAQKCWQPVRFIMVHRSWVSPQTANPSGAAQHPDSCCWTAKAQRRPLHIQ